ncbi:MAG: hypothetical protein J6R99_00405 [Alphaproteobacteria bacterium]|nr:hypothetical protein [Alphaproteobacteria bacterium]
MGWLNYVFKTSLKQKQQNWTDYKLLRKNCYNAQRLLNAARANVEMLFEEDTELSEYNACIKKKILFSHLECGCNNRLTGREICTTMTSRCTEFAPIDNEKLCTKTMCEAYYKNLQYFNALQRVKQYEQEYKNFWKQKVNQK